MDASTHRTLLLFGINALLKQVTDRQIDVSYLSTIDVDNAAPDVLNNIYDMLRDVLHVAPPRT